MSSNDDMDDNGQCGGKYREPPPAASSKDPDQALSNNGGYLSDESASRLIHPI
jgi:hypothetical protein